MQILAFAPYGYICSANRSLGPDSFVSSGPYRVKASLPWNGFVLEQRSEWPLKSDTSPQIIEIVQQMPETFEEKSHVIIDTRAGIDHIPANYAEFPLVPEYLSAVLLGGTEQTSFFSSIANRRILRKTIERFRGSSPTEWKTYKQSRFFYPSQNYLISDDTNDSAQGVPITPLAIEGKPPSSETINHLNWLILKNALEYLNWPYRFENNVSTFSTKSDPSFDIRLANPAIGAKFEGWGIGYLFCSFLGGNLPDPSRRIAQLVDRFEKNEISEKNFESCFEESVSQDSAVLPLGHYGFLFYLSPSIRRATLSPLVSIVRFEDLEIEATGARHF